MTTKPIIDRFTDKIEISSCWLWTSTLQKHGYGYFKDNNINVLAHRWSYEYFIFDIPVGLQVLHKCDVRKCVNPNHLFLGTNLDNVQDKVKKGRQSRLLGEANGRAVLNKQQVNQIITLYSSRKYSQVQLAKMYNISKTQIGRIVRRETWI